jgi:hypothetical protein
MWLGSLAAGLVFLLAAGPGRTVETTFIGDPMAPFFGPRVYWDTPSLWSHGVPGSNDDVIIPTHVNTGGQIISGYGPTLGRPVTIKSLTMGDFSNLFGAILFVQDTTSLGAAALINFGGQFSLGTLTQYDADTKTLNYGPNLVVDITSASDSAVLQFKGADIVTNKATLQFFGENISFRDQNTGINALQNFADNEGDIYLDDGFELNTSSNFKNSGRISLNYRRTLSGPTVPGNGMAPELHIAGNFINDGRVELYAKSVLTVSGGLSGSGTIKIFGLPVVCNVVGNWDQNGGNLGLGGSGIDSFTLKATAFQARNNATITGSGTIEALVTITSGKLSPGSSPGTVNVKGNLTLEAGSTLEMEIAGTAHDKIIQTPGTGPTTGTTLGGLLTVSTIDDFDDEVLATSTYEILTASAPLTGSFSNIANGARLTTTSGKGSFRVNYGPGTAAPNKVILSDYIALNTPQTYAQWIVEQGVAAPDNDPLDDPNHDGISNLEAYCRGMSAGGPGRHAGIKIITTQTGVIEVTLRVPRTVTGVSLFARTMNGFAFSDMPASVPLPLSGTTPTRNLYTVTLLPFTPRKFVRFGMNLNPP